MREHPSISVRGPTGPTSPLRALLAMVGAALLSFVGGCVPVFFADGEVDVDGDGASPGEGDCADREPAVGPTHPELCGDGLDNDCDGAIDDADGPDTDEDGFGPCEDCDDGTNQRFPGAPEVCDGFDSDCDGATGPEEADADGDGSTVCAGDCDDGDPEINAAAAEVCDDTDNDCDGGADGADPQAPDLDGDGAARCVDCDDTDPGRAPGAAEGCDGSDNDCDGNAGGGEGDEDGDAWRPCSGDCDDGNAAVGPAAAELCDGVDNDCDGSTPGSESDADGDGTASCAGDCDDTRSNIGPSAPEVCDGFDSNCDGSAGPGEVDLDGDGTQVCEGDCADTDDSRAPGLPELCDGLDSDCDGAVPTLESDADGDLFAPCAGDCDALDPASFPGAPEVCDGSDSDCDGVLPISEADADSDGQRPCAGDCDDGDNQRWTGAGETCDGLDNDCDGLIPLGESDLDADGSSSCVGDCDDGDPTRSPALAETCALGDEDCDGLDGDADFGDGDGDGIGPCVDCDDGAPTIGPGSAEHCDGIDEDCDGVVDEGSDPAPALLSSGGSVGGTLRGVGVAGLGSVLGLGAGPAAAPYGRAWSPATGGLLLAPDTGTVWGFGCNGEPAVLATVPGGPFAAMAGGDLDADGVEDLAVVDLVGELWLHAGPPTNPGPGQWVASWAPPTQGTRTFAPTLLDEDGLAAWFALDFNSGESAVMRLVLDGFEAVGSPASVVSFEGGGGVIDGADLDADGLDDLLIGPRTEPDAGEITVFWQGSGASWSLPEPWWDALPAVEGPAEVDGAVLTLDVEGDLAPEVLVTFSDVPATSTVHWSLVDIDGAGLAAPGPSGTFDDGGAPTTPQMGLLGHRELP